MDWVKEFYTAQNDWFGVYLGEVEDSHRERAELIQKMVEKPALKILELGGGGGQTAIALAELGHEVTMVELLEDSASHAQQLANQLGIALKVIQGDFYEVNFDTSFDVICYFDSFGIGSDADQRRLLKCIYNWMKPDACTIIEIGSTCYWSGVAKGRQMDLGACVRQYDFDAAECRLIDSWWRKSSPATVVHQSLRCYTPMDLKLLLTGTGLQLTNLKAGGKVNYDEMKFIKEASLQDAMTYYVQLIKDDKSTL